MNRWVLLHLSLVLLSCIALIIATLDKNNVGIIFNLCLFSFNVGMAIFNWKDK